MALEGFRLPPRSAWPGPLSGKADPSDGIYAFGEALADQFPWDHPEKRRALTSAADPRQVEFLGLWVLDGEVCNGGFCQFFSNSFGELAEEAVAGFRRLGMPGFAALADEVFDIFPRPISWDRRERNLMLENHFGTPGAGENIFMRASGTFDPFDDRYFALRRGGGRDWRGVGFWDPVCAFLDAHAGLFFQLD